MYKKLISAFTLIELLMVISIITLISTIFFSYIGTAGAKSRDSVRLSDMKQINTAASMYYEDKGEMPESIGVKTGVDINKTLVGAGYLSAEPRDPKTGQSYSFRTGTIGGKPVAVVSATYEKIYTTNFAGEEIPQQVGVIVGDIDLSQVCSLVSHYAEIFGSSDDKFPTCDSSNTSNDQIVGYSGGHRSGGSKTSVTTESNISDCSESQISEICPSTLLDNCYCGGTLNNINSEFLSQTECKSEYGLFWDDGIQPNRCFDQITCESASRVWINGVCNPVVAPSLIWSGNYYTNWTKAVGVCSGLGESWRLPLRSELREALTNQFVYGGSNPGGFVVNYKYWTSESNARAYRLEYNGIEIVENYVDKSIVSDFRCVK